MDKQLTNDTISNLVAIGYFWIGDDNPQCSLNICKLLQELNNLTKAQKKSVDDLYHDWKALFLTKYKEDKFEVIKIPKNYTSDDERKLLWISSQAIMNMIASANFEMAYMFLLEMSQEWNELYINVIDLIRKSEFKLSFSEWLTMHFMLALDINGKKDMELAGFRIEKLEDGEFYE